MTLTLVSISKRTHFYNYVGVTRVTSDGVGELEMFLHKAHA